MTINPLLGTNPFSAGAQIQRTNASVLKFIRGIVGGGAAQTGDVASLSIAVSLQANSSALRVGAQNLVQADSALQVAGNAISEQGKILDRLAELAVQARNPALNEATRQTLNTEFQGLSAQLDDIATTTKFNGKPLLDGTYTASISRELGDADGDADALTVPDLRASALFGGRALDISTPQGAESALEALTPARVSLSTAQASVGSFRENLEFATANVQSAWFNQVAAASSLDGDFASDATGLSSALLQQSFAVAAQKVQTERLAPSMLELITSIGA